MVGYTKGKWEQLGSLIVAYGDDGAVICKMAQPLPPSGLTEFIPLNIGDGGWDLQMANARLIAAAPDMYEALKAILYLAKGYAEMPKDKIIEYLEPILAKAEKQEATQ